VGLDGPQRASALRRGMYSYLRGSRWRCAKEFMHSETDRPSASMRRRGAASGVYISNAAHRSCTWRHSEPVRRSGARPRRRSVPLVEVIPLSLASEARVHRQAG